jgi:hypothetical protein
LIRKGWRSIPPLDSQIMPASQHPPQAEAPLENLRRALCDETDRRLFCLTKSQSSSRGGFLRV